VLAGECDQWPASAGGELRAGHDFTEAAEPRLRGRDIPDDVQVCTGIRHRVSSSSTSGAGAVFARITGN